MIDHLRLLVPFSPVFCTELQQGGAVLAVDLLKLGVPIAAQQVTRDEHGNISTAGLRHCYESLPTSFTSLAMKIYADNRYGMPYVELKGSPAKILQGHNVFGPLDLELCALEMLGYLSAAYPFLSSMLQPEKTIVGHIDITFSARLKSANHVNLAIDYLSRVRNGQTKPTADKKFTNTAYWGGQHSRLVQLKAYGKFAEFTAQLNDFKKSAESGDESASRVYSVMSDPRLLSWVESLLRWEARIKQTKLKRLGLPVLLFDLIKHQRDNPTVFVDLWKQATKPVFDALEGQTMKVLDDDSILEQLKSVHFSVTRSGRVSYTKASNLFGAYCAMRAHGIEFLKSRYTSRRMNQIISDLVEAGFSKAFLQNLHTADKGVIIPMIRLIDVDFSAQYPDWYVEPVSSFADKAA